MILFKACPRCGGDVDATFRDDVNCVQCAYRPPNGLSGSRDSRRQPPQAEAGPRKPAHAPAQLAGVAPGGCEVPCPRCEAEDSLRLEKLRPQDNTCYRCRRCGHIFSPRAAGIA